MVYTPISSLNHLQSEMLKSLSFYKDDLHIMETRLQEVAWKNTSFEARQDIEHFENQFILQRNNIGRLRHHINEFVQEAAGGIKAHDNHVKDALAEKQNKLEEDYKTLERVIGELLRDFNRFLTKWM
ncbi:MAG: hypothetical protein Q8941_15150 [Bacteroidota bacterium]|nr:hypothetical protein [Bacteroidota bacterium]